MAGSDAFDETGLLVSAVSRPLRRQLRAVEWVTLEEVALDAALEGGRLVARTSARRIAEQLGLDPGTAAGALRVLRDRGLVVLEREQGTAGRFGLSVYALDLIAGLTVVRTPVHRPCLVQPCAENAHTGQPASSLSWPRSGREPFEPSAGRS